LPIPDPKTLPIFRRNFAAVGKKYAASPFARDALGSAFDKPTWTETDHSVPVRDGNTIKVRIYMPNGRPQDSHPVIVWTHGGGWIMGDLDTEALTCRIFAARLNIVVINVDYRLYPEVKFGVPAADCIDAVKWVAKYAGSFGGNLQRGFIVGGHSGGATYAAIATHLLRDDKLAYPITGCYYSAPIFPDEISIKEDGEAVHMFDVETENRSFEQNKDAPLMNREMQKSIESTLH
jgi:acetyl esterase/lipase